MAVRRVMRGAWRPPAVTHRQAGSRSLERVPRASGCAESWGAQRYLARTSRWSCDYYHPASRHRA
eukprot:scaffold2030_cov388-Prasinococcus_capsulatus_cf.AAC.1